MIQVLKDQNSNHNFDKFFDKIFINVKFNLKSFLNNLRLLSIVLIFFILGIILCMCLIPYQRAGGALLLLYQTVPLFIIMGWFSFNLRNSILFKNLKLNGYKTRWFYLSQLITLFIIGNILSLIFWILMFFFVYFGLFLSEWSFISNQFFAKGTIIFNNNALINLIYITNINILLVFSIYFAIHSLIKDSKQYYFIIMVILLIGIFFGGSLNTYWNNPIGNNLVKLEDGSYRINYKNKSMIMYGGLFPEKMFIPTLFFCPIYGTGEFLNFSVTKTGVANEIWGSKVYISEGVEYYFNLNQINNVFAPIFYKENWQWLLVVLQPYIWILSSLFVGNIFEKIRKDA